MGVVTIHTLPNFLKCPVLNLSMLHGQPDVLVAGKTNFSHRFSQQFRLARSMCVMAFQATFAHRLVNGSRLLHAVGKNHVAVQADLAWCLTEQFRLVRHMGAVTTQASSIHNRLVFDLPLDRLRMTLLAQRPRSLRSQMGARIPSVWIVTFKTCLLRHRLMRIVARLKLVTEQAEIASLTG